MNATLRFLPNGIVQALHTEVIDLACLGWLQVERLSTIEFDNSLQRWCVRSLKGHCLYSSTSRQDCLNWEREYFEKHQ